MRDTYNFSIVGYQPLEAGVLSGKYRREREAPAGSRGSERPAWIPKLDESQYEKLEALDRLSSEAGISPAEYSIAWVLSRPAVAGLPSWVAGNEDQMMAAVRAVDVDNSFRAPGGNLDAQFPPARPGGRRTYSSVARQRLGTRIDGDWVLLTRYN